MYQYCEEKIDQSQLQWYIWGNFYVPQPGRAGF